jgi:VanZ family protein
MSRLASQGRAVGSLLLRWGPLILWLVVASLLSTDGLSGRQTSRYLIPLLHWVFPAVSLKTLIALHVGIRKAIHVFEFGVLAWLWYRALKWGETGWQPQAAVRAFLLAAAFGTADEFHQSFQPHRSASAADVGWDSLGAFFGLGSCWMLRGEEEPSRKANAPGGVPPGGAWLG